MLRCLIDGAFVPQDLRGVKGCDYSWETEPLEGQRSGSNLLRGGRYNNVERGEEGIEAGENIVEKAAIRFERNERKFLDVEPERSNKEKTQ